MTEQGYWNGLPTEVRRVVGTVRHHDPATDPPYAWWAGKEYPGDVIPGLAQPHVEDLQGQRVQAVEVNVDGAKVYLDDRDGSAWHKVTEGKGSPRLPHRELPLVDVTSIEDEPSSPPATATARAIEILRAENERRYQRLAAQGLELDLFDLFLNALLEAVFPDDAKREAFLLAVEKRTAAVIEIAEQRISGLVIARPSGQPMNRAERRRVEREQRR